ncbi:MAG: gamma-glutamyltransferase [Candidatus Poribacteria bacterium]|nr:gamma-glutamyltransferase [Candidatus Poribacteria bacterium]
MIQSRIEFTREEVVAENGVVAGGHDLVAQVGVEIMQQGGNAVDAGVAAAFVAQLAEPGMCGVGGNGIILAHRADKSETTVLDDTTVAPAAATPDMFELLPGSGGFYGWENVRDNANIIGHKSVAIPGTVAGLCAVLERHGTMRIKDVLAPAIELAENGVEVDARTAVVIARTIKHFRRFPLLGALYLVDGLSPTPGTFWAPGNKLVYPELADTYRAIAEGGADAFYKGRIAEVIAAEIARHGGILTYEDLASYRSDVRDLQAENLGEYRGLRYTPGDSTFLTQTLNILEHFDLPSLGPDSPIYRHVMLETMKRAWVNYFAFPREPGLLTKEYAGAVAGLIRLDKASHDVKPVHPWSYQDDEPPKQGHRGAKSVGGHDTTTLAVADSKGNVFNMLTSLGNAFGSYVVIPGTGIVMNDHMCNFEPVPGRPLSLGPNRRPPRGAHVPVFFRAGKPFLAVDAPGARRSMSGVVHVLVHCIDFKMGIQEAIEAPRVWAEALYDEAFLDSRIPEPVQRALADMGHRIVTMDAATSGGFGRPTAVSIDPSGKLHAGADPLYNTGVAGF